MFIIIIADLLSHNEFKFRQYIDMMFLFVVMNSNLTSGLICSHSRLVLTEPDLDSLKVEPTYSSVDYVRINCSFRVALIL